MLDSYPTTVTNSCNYIIWQLEDFHHKVFCPVPCIIGANLWNMEIAYLVIKMGTPESGWW
jgi:hypothetical protein